MEDAVIWMAIWPIFQPFSIFYDMLVYFVVMWYIIIILVHCPTKNLATLQANG
jgi:hypothetical protein